MKSVVIVALYFLFQKKIGGKGDAGEDILINGDVLQMGVRAP